MDIVIKFLGISQDAGIPQIGCNCKVCNSVNKGERKKEYPVSLGIINNLTGKKFLIEATPALGVQYNKLIDIKNNETLSGIILSHAHIGHYGGLLSLGKEALNSKGTNVYTSLEMGKFLKENAPWSQLIKLENINIIEFENRKKLMLDENLSIIPIEVEHRNEFADTYGFIIEGKEKIFFLPDIDSWNGFEEQLERLIKECKYVILDATFYTKDEIEHVRGRKIDEIPHPTIEETIRFIEDRKLDSTKIILTHFNHTNLVLSDDKLRKNILDKGFIISEEDFVIEI